MEAIDIDIQPLGDRACTLLFGDSIDPQIHEKIFRFCTLIQQSYIPGIIEWVPTYTTITIYYDPSTISYRELSSILYECYKQQQNKIPVLNHRTVIIPVKYGGEWGPDLSEIATYNSLNETEVISIHSKPTYLVYMLGFAPGFPYLGGMSSRIATPRLATPRTQIPAGSVGIADQQTGIYPLSTPGGWQIIGRTPIQLFDPNRNPPILLQMGDYICFRPITDKEYYRIKEECQMGIYQVEIQ